MADVPRVVATEAARALLARLRAKHGEILIYQSHGCCDGSTPMAFKPAELSLGRDDLLYAEVDGTPLWMGRTQVDYTIGTQLILDVGQGSLGPSLWKMAKASISRRQAALGQRRYMPGSSNILLKVCLKSGGKAGLFFEDRGLPGLGTLC
ncbi:DUF779 domain-containing protein [Ideonella paludis]|uniref:DUF779 domain-containing protein n=1 Tax=Ideonella paludis TaxID=1233411 RepID=UPI00363FCDA4